MLTFSPRNREIRGAPLHDRTGGTRRPYLTRSEHFHVPALKISRLFFPVFSLIQVPQKKMSSPKLGPTAGSLRGEGEKIIKTSERVRNALAACALSILNDRRQHRLRVTRTQSYKGLPVTSCQMKSKFQCPRIIIDFYSFQMRGFRC